MTVAGNILASCVVGDVFCREIDNEASHTSVEAMNYCPLILWFNRFSRLILLLQKLGTGRKRFWDTDRPFSKALASSASIPSRSSIVSKRHTRPAPAQTAPSVPIAVFAHYCYLKPFVQCSNVRL